MGYKRQRNILNLKFEDEPGLEILARSCSVRRFLWVLRTADKMTAGKLPDKELEEFTDWFAGRIVSWNIEGEDDKPVPVSADYLLDEDIEWAAKVAMGWVGGVLKLFNVPLDLGALARLAEMAQQPGADRGTDPVEGSIPMSPAMPG